MKAPCVDWSLVDGWKLKPFEGMLEGMPSNVAARASANGFSYGVEAGWRAAFEWMERQRMEEVVERAGRRKT